MAMLRRYVYHFNGTRSTVAVTDMTGNVVNSYAYDPFGTVLSDQETVRQPFKFVGQYGARLSRTAYTICGRDTMEEPGWGIRIGFFQNGFGGRGGFAFPSSRLAFVHTTPLLVFQATEQ